MEVAQDERYACHLAAQDDADVSELVRLSHSSDMKVRRLVAQHPLVPEEDLRRLAQDSSYKVVSSVAANPSTPPDVLLSLSKGTPLGIQYKVAQNPNTPTAAVDKLAFVADWNTRIFAIKSSAISPEVLVTLSDDEAVNVRRAVAHNPKTPPKTLERLSYDIEFAVRSGVASNPSTPAAALSRLANEELLGMPLAKNPTTPVDALLKIAASRRKDAKLRLAQRNDLTAEIVEKLDIYGTYSEITDRIISNHHAPPNVLEKLSHHNESSVVATVGGNPSTPFETLVRLANSPDDMIRSAVAENDSMGDIEVLTALSFDGEPRVRIALYNNVSLPLSVLRALMTDTNPAVRYAAALVFEERYLDV